MDRQVKSTGIARQFVGYVGPAVTGMVVSSLYTVVDGIFVGRGVGSTALAAVNIVFPFIMLQIAVTMLLAVGGANLFSMRRGAGQSEEADGLFAQSMALLAAAGLLLNVAAIAFSGPLCRFLGADEALLPMAREYLFWIALFGIPYMPGLGLSIFVRNDGAPQLEMLGTVCGALVNILLDWAFIMLFGWGLAGAAIATGIGQLVSVGIFLCHLGRKKCGLKLRRPRFGLRQAGRLLYNGLPSFLMEFSQSAITLSFNMALVARLGAAGVSAYSIVMYVCSIFNMVLIGIVQGAQPIISYNHGRRAGQNVRRVFALGVGSCLGATALFYLVVLLFGRGLAGLFTRDDAALVDMAVRMMRIYFVGFFPVGVSLMNILYLQATEREGPSILISLLRCVGFVQLFLLTLPGLLGNDGIMTAFFCGEMCNCIVSIWLHARCDARLGRRAAQGA